MTPKTVFLSSTGGDLQECRDAVRAGIALLGGYYCDGMENFPARDCQPEDFCQKKVEEADVVICIIGHLYGSCPPDSQKSYTEIEYDTAVKNSIHRLAFVASDKVFIPPVYRRAATNEPSKRPFGHA